MFSVYFFFFFSSRRRHTRLQGDWSSDVCSSDLIVVRVAEEVLAAAGMKDQHYLVGTMIEIPRAALTADSVAAEAQFFSFGTNDLTQTTMGLSRDDYTKFQQDY